MTGTTAPVARIDDLRVTFATDGEPVSAINGISLEAHAGEVLAIVGESGSGKTVTANTLLGLLPETATLSGAVIVRGPRRRPDRYRARDPRAAACHARARRRDGVPGALDRVEPGLHRGLADRRGPARPREAVEGRGEGQGRRHPAPCRHPRSEKRVDDYPHQFSGGQKQRVVIAMALVLNAGLIIADEPTTALDVTVQAEILDLLRTCRDEFGATIVLITHNMGVVADLADRVIVMYRGDIVEQAPVRELFAAPRQAYTRELLAAVPHVGRGKSARQSLETAAPTSPPEGSLVVAEKVEIGYPGRFGSSGVVAVKGVDFWIGPGEVLGLVGESGSGKTTIGRAMVGLTSVVGGSLKVLGTEMRGAKPRALAKTRPDIGFVFQDPATSFNPLLTIAECIAEPLVVHRRVSGARAARTRVNELLDAVQLPTAFGDRYPHELSGGQRQRASLARALALDPKLLIADEPTSALDVSVQARVLQLFAQLQAEFGFACLFISHDLAVVDEVADRVVVLQQGVIREQGTTVQVLTEPRDDYTKRLLVSLPVPDPVEQQSRRELWRSTRGV